MRRIVLNIPEITHLMPYWFDFFFSQIIASSVVEPLSCFVYFYTFLNYY